MRGFIFVATVCLCSCLALAQTQNQGLDRKVAAKRPPWPLQLEMRVPFEPTALPSGVHVYLMYELHLTNFMPMPVSVSRIDVFESDKEAAQPIASFETAQLQTMLQPLGGKPLSDPKDRLTIADGQSTIAFMSVEFDRNSHIPDRLFHRVTTSYAPEDGAVISTHHTELRTFGHPVQEAEWLAEDGPSNDQNSSPTRSCHPRRTTR